VADAVESLGQDVQQEAPDELVWVQSHGLPDLAMEFSVCEGKCGALHCDGGHILLPAIDGRSKSQFVNLRITLNRRSKS
jgi:hypothetical protein